MATNLSNLHHETQKADGSMHPNWQRVIGALGSYTDLEVQKRQQDIARQLRTNGTAYSPMLDEQHASRPWNLDLAPMVIEPEEFRFVPDAGLDPMANGQSGTGGITGLFQAVRKGGVKILNSLGSGVLENPALNAYLSELCKHVLGQELELQGPPTYWLGEARDRQHVMTHRDDLLLRNVDSQGQLFDPKFMDDEQLAKLHINIDLTPQRYVAQERLDRSVVPAYKNAGHVLH